ncbi:circularly permuted type 2 ATP-grasp protein [Methylocystis sp. JR02]|uniref:circularly permuted type 2 ATP-grasp protein n=1 Tax=Methylocystis sp. JR02 TaxID=3046284 RepID=UPI0024B8B9C5|nr:circularly permuted type 2 ATP-grasp protein [Methylocystis sp. JR02]MDJ0447494.1 circularly permuted type 2 ATP-grasp protein [Methylocystis sp. JR02]
MAVELDAPATDAEAALGEEAGRLAAWIADYKPMPGVPDELIGPDGRPRAHWMTLLETLAGLGRRGVENRFAAAARRINDMGVTYRVRGEARERPWPLGRLPLLLTENEWSEIAAGVAQRAELLDRILHDVYGDARLVSEGALPAAVVAGSPEFIRPMCGVAPVGGRWLRFYAVDIGRGPDGKWWVLGDRAQAPSGAGYAIENRLILARAFPSLYREMKVRRLAGFFRDFRAGLAAAATRNDPRICLMTPGPWSETYAEQVYLARYLGFLLVEGEDLATSEGKLHVRTVAGLKRADVVWRRVDADWLDPLEANAASRLGAPGFFDAIRRGSVAMANMPGAGLVESRALMSFLPALAQRLMGESLRLPNVATWWCGQEAERAEILRAFDSRAIAGAFGDKAEGLLGAPAAVGAELDAAQKERLIAAIRARGMDYVGQEVVKLSTTPAWDNGALTPRPFSLRIFAAATPEGWKVMPGGFCRVSDRRDARAITMGAGAQTVDVWVIGQKASEHATTLLPPNNDVPVVRVPGHLPSRAADNLFWMGRYLERAEATLRIVRCLCNRMTEIQSNTIQGRQPIERCERLLFEWGAAAPFAAAHPGAVIALTAASNADFYGSARAVVGEAKRAASIIRERLSQDMWQLLVRLETRLESAAARPPLEPEILELTERALHTLAALSGLMDENFNRVSGWAFIDLGKRMERAINTCRFARQFADNDPTIEALDALLELVDSQITYRSRYLAGAALAPTLDITLLDPFNPRSVAFQMRRIDEHLASLPALVDDGMMEPQRRLAVSLRADLEAEDARGLDAKRVRAVEQKLLALANAISERYFSHSSDPAPADKRSKLA